MLWGYTPLMKEHEMPQYRPDDDAFATEARERLGDPGTDAIGRLRHTVKAFEAQPEHEMVILATMNVYPERTGITWGDLRAILAQLEQLGH